MTKRIHTLADVQALVDGAIFESRELEFKRELKRVGSAGASDWQDEFAKDVSALANTRGGQIVYGLEEKEGAASRIIGIDLNSLDAIRSELLTNLQNKLQPRLIGVEIDAIKLDDGKSLIVVTIPRSRTAPHAAVLNNNRLDFWVRNLSNNARMDVEQLRAAFRPDYEAAKVFRDFRNTRFEALSRIVEGQNLSGIAVHWFPQAALDAGAAQIEISTALRAVVNDDLCPPILFDAFAEAPSPNFEGIIRARKFVRAPIGILPQGHCQLYRNGVIEGFSFFYHNGGEMFLTDLEGAELLIWIRKSISFLLALDFEAFPGFFSIDLLGKKDVTLYVNNNVPIPAGVLKPPLQFPEIYIAEKPESWPMATRLLFDHIWQAAGKESSPWMADDGKWVATSAPGRDLNK